MPDAVGTGEEGGRQNRELGVRDRSAVLGGDYAGNAARGLGARDERARETKQERAAENSHTHFKHSAMVDGLRCGKSGTGAQASADWRSGREGGRRLVQYRTQLVALARQLLMSSYHLPWLIRGTRSGEQRARHPHGSRALPPDQRPLER